MKLNLPLILWLTGISALVLFTSSVFRHELFNSSGDLAFFDQGVYLISQGQTPISSIEGFNVLADHAAWILYFVASLYKIYPSVYWLFGIQSGALALGAIPTYFLALQAGLKESQAVAIVVAYLLYPVVYNSDLADFHPDTIAVPALLSAVLAARNKKTLWFILSILLVLSCKSVLALTIAAMGCWLFWFENRRLYGAIAIISGVAWFVIADGIIIPFVGGEAASINRHLYRYSYLGSSFGNIGEIILFHPQVLLRNLFSPINLEYLILLFSPVIWGLIPKYLDTLIVAIPCILLNLLATQNSQKNLVLHYSLPAIPFLMLALIKSLAAGKAWLQQKRAIVMWSLVGFLALGKYTLFTSSYIRYWDTWQATREAIALVKTPDSVLTIDIITPHLTHRNLISFQYNNPVKLEELNNFHYFLFNIRHPGWSVSAEQLDNLVKLMKNQSEFELKYQRDDVYLFERKS